MKFRRYEFMMGSSSWRTLAATKLSAVCLAALTLVASPAQASQYVLGVADRLRIKIVEFNQNTLIPNEWSVLGGEYSVDSAGNVLMPIIGAVKAAGLTTPELNEAVARSVRKAIGVEDSPNPITSITASIEIVEYRPFYILGSVQKPGAYAYRPDLNVLQAVSVAGGYPNLAATSGWSIERDSINAQGTLRNVTLKLAGLLVRQVRLRAEEEGKSEMAIPAELADQILANSFVEPDAFEKIKAEETAIFAARASELKRQIEALDRQNVLLENEIEALLRQVDSQNRQAELIAKDLKSVNSLVDRGLAVTSRRLTLDRALADAEGRALQYQTAVIQVRQDLNKSERERSAIIDKRQNEIAGALRETQTMLDSTREEITTNEGLLAKLALAGPAATQSSAVQIRQVYTIVSRNERGEPVEKVDVSEDTPVNPGDTVKVTVELPNGAAAAVGPTEEDATGGFAAAQP